MLSSIHLLPDLCPFLEPKCFHFYCCPAVKNPLVVRVWSPLGFINPGCGGKAQISKRTVSLPLGGRTSSRGLMAELIGEKAVRGRDESTPQRSWQQGIVTFPCSQGYAHTQEYTPASENKAATPEVQLAENETSKSATLVWKQIWVEDNENSTIDKENDAWITHMWGYTV